MDCRAFEVSGSSDKSCCRIRRASKVVETCCGKHATIPDEDARLTAIRALLTEETHIGMMVGVAVGWALRAELAGKPGTGRASEALTEEENREGEV